MPKMKTKSSAKKRFRFTASGKVKHGKAYCRHLLRRRNRRSRQDAHGGRIVEQCDMILIQHCMPYGK